MLNIKIYFVKNIMHNKIFWNYMRKNTTIDTFQCLILTFLKTRGRGTKENGEFLGDPLPLPYDPRPLAIK